jgi:PHD/YefM family antitoxin component YafN of YafNO toxin-antitoxin module
MSATAEKTKTIAAPIDLATLAEAARREPVTVIADGKPAFVAVDLEAYERMAKAERQLRERAWDRLEATMDKMAQTAAAAGLTEDELERLLADES